MADAILVLNAGSSSLKFTEFVAGAGGALEVKVAGNLEELYGQASFRARDAGGQTVGEHAWAEPPRHAGALEFLLGWPKEHSGDTRVAAIGHRVVHGGELYAAPMRVDAKVLDTLEQFVPLAPLHQPHNLLPIRTLLEAHPDIPQVACFDTAFHRTIPPLAEAYALPPSITDRGVRRYGFHGLSYEYIAGVLPQHDPRAAAGRTIVLHLGNGASMCALKGGVSVASTMGFTALDGLPMGTRCGALDPGVVLYLMQSLHMDAAAIETLLYKESGLLGVSGVSSDMRALLESREPRAELAVDLFVYRIVREMGSLAAALGGLDAVVFTAGIGERAAPVRRGVCEGSRWLGIELDEQANARSAMRISTPTSPAAVWVLPTNEELMIARHAHRIVAGT